MIWTQEKRREALTLHAQGYTDRQMADHFGIARSKMASYRANCLRVPANYGRIAQGEVRKCEYCDSRMAQGQYRRHLRRAHNMLLPRVNKSKLRMYPRVALLNPSRGRFDSTAAVWRFLEMKGAA